nr:hypothetical protein [Tanacetum cinerariifolium]
MDEGFTATDYPKLQENLKLTVEEHVILKDPACSSRTLSSLQHLTKDLSFGDLFFNDKPSEVDNEKTTAKTEAESVNKHLEERLDSHGARLYKLENLDIPTRMWETNSYKTHEDHMQLYEALKKSMNRDHSKELLKDLAKARKKKKKRCPSGASRSPRAYVSSKVPPSPPPPPSTKQKDDEDIRKAHIPKVNMRQDWWKPLEEERPATPEPAWFISSSDTGDIAMFMDWFCKRQEITELKPQDLEGPAFKLVKIFHPNVIHLQYQMDECHKLLTDSVDDLILKYNVGKPLPVGGLPGQVTIQSEFFFNKDLEYLRYGSKGGRPTLSMSKMKAVYYPDVGLEQMVPNSKEISSRKLTNKLTKTL